MDASGARTDDGWCFEASIPWDVIAENIDISSFSVVQFNFNKMTSDGNANRGCIFLCDRVFDPEENAVTFDNVFATLSEYSVRGMSTKYVTFPSIGSYGLDVVALRDSHSYTKPQEKTTIRWQNSFSDLNSDAWYYKAVSCACDNGWFSGMSDTEFAPNVTLTRAMFVTILARLARYNGYTATGEYFDDVPPNSWFAPAIEWAAENNIASGMGDNKFMPNASLTREQAALLLFKLAQFKHYRTDGVPDNTLNEFPDAEIVSYWAYDAMSWAVYNRMITGVEKGEINYLNPTDTATRAQCAQICNAFDSNCFNMLAYVEEYSSMTICGTDISEFSVVCGSEEQDSKAAQELIKYIALTTGVTLNLYRDIFSEPAQHEILIGQTNRESDWAEIDRSQVTVEGFTVVSKDGKLLISGGNQNGTLYGTYWFLEKYLNWIFAAQDNEARCYTESISIPDGICTTENSPIVKLAWFTGGTGEWKDKVRLCGNRVDDDDAVMCTIPYLLDGNMENHKNANPCYSDETIIQRLIDATLARMENNPTHRNFDFGCYDNCSYCTCDRCVQVYREEKSRAGTYVRLINRVAAAVKEAYPENTLLLQAYDFTTDVPVSDLEDNIIVRYITITMCWHHNLDNPDCPLNVYSYKNILGWREKCHNRFYIGDHGNTCDFYLTPVMNIEYIYNNFRIYGDLDFSGFMIWGNGEPNGDITELRNYLIAHMLWESDITRDVYQIYEEAFLQSFYGEAWKSVLDYMDAMNEIQDTCHIDHRATPSASVNPTMFLDYDNELDNIWNEAYAVTTGDERAHSNVLRTSAHYLFIRQVMLWDRDYNNGDEDKRADYIAKSEDLYNLVELFNIKWGESVSLLTPDYTVNPEYWT